MDKLFEILVEAIYEGLSDLSPMEFNSPRSFLINVDDISYVDVENTTLYLGSKNIGFFVTEESMFDLLDLVSNND